MPSGRISSPAYDKLARGCFRQKKYDLALEAIEKAVALAPNDLALQRRRDAVRQAIQEGPP